MRCGYSLVYATPTPYHFIQLLVVVLCRTLSTPGHCTQRYVAVTVLPCVFYIVSQVREFVKHFFHSVAFGTFGTSVPRCAFAVAVRRSFRSVVRMMGLYHSFLNLSRGIFHSLAFGILCFAWGVSVYRVIHAERSSRPFRSLCPCSPCYIGCRGHGVPSGFLPPLSISVPRWYVEKVHIGMGLGCPLPYRRGHCTISCPKCQA